MNALTSEIMNELSLLLYHYQSLLGHCNICFPSKYLASHFERSLSSVAEAECYLASKFYQPGPGY